MRKTNDVADSDGESEKPDTIKSTRTKEQRRSSLRRRHHRRRQHRRPPPKFPDDKPSFSDSEDEDDSGEETTSSDSEMEMPLTTELPDGEVQLTDYSKLTTELPGGEVQLLDLSKLTEVTVPSTNNSNLIQDGQLTESLISKDAELTDCSKVAEVSKLTNSCNETEESKLGDLEPLLIRDNFTLKKPSVTTSKIIFPSSVNPSASSVSSSCSNGSKMVTGISSFHFSPMALSLSFPFCVFLGFFSFFSFYSSFK